MEREFRASIIGSGSADVEDDVEDEEDVDGRESDEGASFDVVS